VPAALCGVVGLKATYGRISCPSAHGGYSSVTVQGALTNCVRDAALVYSVIANNGALLRPYLLRPWCSCFSLTD
jgi:Asp-tRNA(Asn)/Glu-tRNA(Gln) amidotransferase A subunit family amidase